MAVFAPLHCVRGMLWWGLCVLVCALPLSAQDKAGSNAWTEVGALKGPILDARLAEHLFNRFGFGATSQEIQAVIGLHSTELFDRWMKASSVRPAPQPVHHTYLEYGEDSDGNFLDEAPINGLDDEAAEKIREALRIENNTQYRTYLDRWFNHLVKGDDPVRDRLTLFWHGFFPTSSRIVLRRYELIHQHHFMHTNALGGFDDLLRGMVVDPAMLKYFDNENNVKTHPNENFARELMELYSLGIGKFTEKDVREAARALTGHQGASGFFVLDSEMHDSEEKTILGQTGNFDGVGFANILLQQPACGEYVARRLLTWFEGVEPTPVRLKHYASLMRQLDYEIQPWLRALCADSEFYRNEVVAARILGPLEFLVGACRRLQLEGRETFLYFAAAATGRQVFGPPSVKGWDEGAAWITSSTLTNRGICVGLMVGVLQGHLKRGAGKAKPSNNDARRVERLARRVHALGLTPPKLSAVVKKALGTQATDRAIVDWITNEWLARTPTVGVLNSLDQDLLDCRKRFAVVGPLLSSAAADTVLRHLAYLLLRRPIAQLG